MAHLLLKTFLPLILTFCWWPTWASNGDLKRPLHEIKAAWIVTFLKFVKWPEDLERKETLTVGIIGSSDLGALFDSFEGYEVKGKKLVFKSIDSGTERDLRDCNLLYISQSQDENLQDILGMVDGFPVLTVSEVDHFVDRGGMVAFRVRGEYFFYEINQRVALQHQLTISSQILRRAGRVIKPGFRSAR